MILNSKQSKLTAQSLYFLNHFVSADTVAVVLDESNIILGVENSDLSFQTFALESDELYHFESVTSHPRYSEDDASLRNDIAIIKSDRDFIFNEKVYPACLPPRDFCLNQGTTVTTSGWGRTDPNDNFSAADHFQAVDIPIAQCWSSFYTSYSDINDWFGLGGVRSGIQVCAGIDGDENTSKGTCKGDSGGPLVYVAKEGSNPQWPELYQQIGAVSWGIDCSNAGDQDERKVPGVYSKITKFMKWIEKNSEGGVQYAEYLNK